jgi:serine/threonine-protein kinase
MRELCLQEQAQATLARIREDMRCRLAAGEPVDAQSYLEDDSSWNTESWFVVEVVLAEFLARQQAGQKVYPLELFLRFPQLAGQLRRELEVRGLLGETPRAGQPAESDLGILAEFGEMASPLAELGAHELIRELDRGGMGRVYQARDLALGRVVALKVLRAGPRAGSEEVARFHREARMAACLAHPNLMPVYSVGLFEGQYALTMPYLAGGNLLQQRAKYREIRSAVRLMLPVCRAVAVAHQAGIIHRDLKPANILLDEAGQPMVGDFGLARFADTESEMTDTGQVLGTPAYMSPEQAAGRPLEVGPASDVWSLGVILYLLFTDRKPFEAVSNQVLLYQVRFEDPPPPRRLRRDLPRDLERVVLKCLEKAPRDRYADAGELADDLERWLSGQPVAASPRWFRHRCRSWALLAGGMLGSLLLALEMLLPPSLALDTAEGTPRPKRLVDEPLQDPRIELLRRHEPVELLGATGKPPRHQWVDARGEFPASWSAEDPLTWSTLDWTMMELMHSVPLQRYRLSAQVIHRDSSAGGLVGVYFLHRAMRLPRGKAHLLATVLFNEHDPGASHRASLNLWRHHFWPGEKVRRSITLEKELLPGVPPPRAPARSWHTIVVTVTPERIQATLDGNLVLEHQRADLEQQARLLAPECAAAGTPPRTALGGGLGLLVFRGAASFRNVELTSLSGTNDPGE